MVNKSSFGGKRDLHVNVKTARGRKISSTMWLQRQLNDPYVQRAKSEGYRSRAAFKLMEIDEKFNILKPGCNVVDLGATPGGWSQFAKQKVKSGKVVAIDINEMDPIPDVYFIHHDFTDDKAEELLFEALAGATVDIVLSDMAAASCGHKKTDHIRIMALCEMALDFALKSLTEGGVFVAKILQGGTEKEILDKLKKSFASVKHFKPGASRKDSSEMYVVALDFRGSNFNAE